MWDRERGWTLCGWGKYREFRAGRYTPGWGKVRMGTRDEYTVEEEAVVRSHVFGEFRL